MWRYRRFRARLRRFDRLHFPSPAEAQLAALMGCKLHTVAFLRSWRTGHPFCLIRPAGWYKANYLEREVRMGRGKQQRSIDFANRRERKGIEVDGRDFHNIVDDYEKDEYAASLGWRIERIPAAMVNPRSKQYAPDKAAAKINKLFANK